jgi:hypothetical protein
MKAIWVAGMPALLALTTVTACATSGGSTTALAPTTKAAVLPSAPVATASAAASAASASPLPSDSGAAVTADPCQLVTQSEASSLTGVSFGPGREEQEPGADGEKRCVYGYQTTNVLTVAVVRAVSKAQAQSVKDSLIAEADKALGGTSLAPSAVAGVGDAAEAIHGNDGPIAFSGIYVLSGTWGFMIVDGTVSTAPSTSAMSGQAKTVVTRLPS